jgi:hypothetical protein
LLCKKTRWGDVAFGVTTFAARSSGATFSSVQGVKITLSQPALLLVFAFSSRIRELRLGGWSKIGFPGVIVVEGGEM